MPSNEKKVVQVSLDTKEHSAGKIRATQKEVSFSRHVGELIFQDATRHKIWELVLRNKEDACD